MDIQLPEPPRNQRIVVQYTTGPHAGLLQIVGHTGQFEGLPVPLIPDWEFLGGRKAPINLVASKQRYLLYRELVVPEGMKGFERSQR